MLSENSSTLGCLLSWSLSVAIFCMMLSRSSDKYPVDFTVFYAQARIAAQNPARIYDREARIAEMEKLVALSSGDRSYCHFGYPPFVALALKTLALTGYRAAFRVWQAVSLCLYVAGLLVAARRYPRNAVITTFPLALAYVPFLFMLFSGQLAAVGFIAMICAEEAMQSRRYFLSGLALSLLCYKPTLLVLLLPMLLIRRRWRSLLGFAAGASALALPPLLAWGPQCYFDWVNAVRSLANGSRPLMQYADFAAFWSNLMGGHAAIWLTGICCFALGCFLVPLWLRNETIKAWPATVTATLLVSPYIPLYDTILVIPSFLFTLGAEYPGIAAGFVALSWITQTSALSIHLQPLTVALAAFCLWQIIAASRRQGSGGSAEAAGAERASRSTAA